MAGRRPAPIEVKLATGVRSSRIPKNAPKPPKGIPTPPSHLSDEARRAWFAWVPVLDSMGVLAKADGLALERLCECYAEVVELSRDIQKNGRTQVVVTKSGDAFERQRPQVAMLAAADRRLKSYIVEFGLSPAARSKVHVSQDAEETKADRYFAV